LQVEQKLSIVSKAYLMGIAGMRSNYTVEAIKAAAGLTGPDPPSPATELEDDLEGEGEGWRDEEAANGSVAGTYRSAAGNGTQHSSYQYSQRGSFTSTVAPSGVALGSSLMRSEEEGSPERQPLL
jgi:hypothetical protein